MTIALDPLDAVEFIPTARNCAANSVEAEDWVFVNACRERLAEQMETRTMSKTKSTPGYHETTLEGLRSELVAFNQRLTRLEDALTKKVNAYRRTMKFALVAGALGCGFGLVNFVCHVMEWWS